MQLMKIALAFAITFTSLTASYAVTAADQTATAASEAVATALALTPGYKRDVVLRAVSRNLREFGRPEEGIRAARAMTDGGASELPPSVMTSRARTASMPDAGPHSNPCDAGPWRMEGGGEAKTPQERDLWAEACLLTRDFDWIGLPPIAEVRAVASGLPTGNVKGAVLAMLIRGYGDVATLRFVQSEIDRDDARLPTAARDRLAKMLAEPAILYRLGQKTEALAAAREIGAFEPGAELIRLLVVAGDADAAAKVFELLSGTPPELQDDCYGWFGQIGGLGLSNLGNVSEPRQSIGAFLDLLPASALYRRVCPKGFDAALTVEYLLAAGRPAAAIDRARRAKGEPFLLMNALLQVAQDEHRWGLRAAARAHAEQAADALPAFSPPDPRPSDENTNLGGHSDTISTLAGEMAKPRNFGETSGNTRRRFEIIQLLAATGFVTKADALARKQPAGALRAVALSAAVAGRAGLRFDQQAPMLMVIDAGDL